MNEYQKELQALKPQDEIQGCREIVEAEGYIFITTASHGYLVVPKSDKNAPLAKKICNYGFEGDLAFYLEEDYETGEFIHAINHFQFMTV